MHITKKAFTLVELIVVITILAILGTISFISLQGYSKKARDSKRTSDIANIKVSLELFSLSTGFYPTPDNGEEVLYDNDLLWTQGIVGTNVTTNLSRNLLKKPTDPLHDIEYIYSLASSKKEYEVMSVYEGDLANNGLIDSTYAANKYNIKVEGNYNELFIKTSKHIFPVPSLITSAPLPLDFDLVPTAIESQVITGGNNFPGLNIPNIETSTGGLKMNLSVFSGSINKDSIDDIKKAVVEKIQLAYSGSDIATTSIYKTLLEKTTDDELLAFIDDVVLNKTSSVITETSDTEAPVGGDFSMDTETSSVDITLTITCPEEDQVEMYISGDIVNTLEWETCVSSKNVELTSGNGSKNISIKWKDDEGNESIEVSNSVNLNIDFIEFHVTEDSVDWYKINLNWDNFSIDYFMSKCESVGKKLVANYGGMGGRRYSSLYNYCGGSWGCTLQTPRNDYLKIGFASNTVGNGGPGRCRGVAIQSSLGNSSTMYLDNCLDTESRAGTSNSRSFPPDEVYEPISSYINSSITNDMMNNLYYLIPCK